MATAEEQYRKSLAQLGARLTEIEKKRLQFVYRLPSQYNDLPPETVLQALELMGMYSASHPEGVAELASWLGMSSLQKDIRKRLRKSKEVTLNDRFCLPFCDELYASVDLPKCFEALQQQTRALQAHLELVNRVVIAQTRGPRIYECVGGPESPSAAAAKVGQILHDLAEAAGSYPSGKSTIAMKQQLPNGGIAANQTAPRSEPMRRKVKQVVAAVTASFKPGRRSMSLKPEIATPAEQGRTSFSTLSHSNRRASPPPPLLHKPISSPKPSQSLPNIPNIATPKPIPRTLRPALPPKPASIGQQPLEKRQPGQTGEEDRSMQRGQRMNSPWANDHAASDNRSQDKHGAQEKHGPHDVYDDTQEWQVVVHRTRTFH